MAYTQACKRADSLIQEFAATLAAPGDSAAAASGDQTGATATGSACVAAPKNARRRLQQRGAGELETTSMHACLLFLLVYFLFVLLFPSSLADEIYTVNQIPHHGGVVT